MSTVGCAAIRSIETRQRISVGRDAPPRRTTTAKHERVRPARLKTACPLRRHGLHFCRSFAPAQVTLHEALTGLGLSASADSAGGLRMSTYGKGILGSFASPRKLRYVYGGYPHSFPRTVATTEGRRMRRQARPCSHLERLPESQGAAGFNPRGPCRGAAFPSHVDPRGLKARGSPDIASPGAAPTYKNTKGRSVPTDN